MAARPTPDQLVREAQQKYLAAISMLSRDVNRHRSQLDPIMLRAIRCPRLGTSIAPVEDTRRVVNENPGDPIALQYLLAAYSKKVDVLREMTAEVGIERTEAGAVVVQICDTYYAPQSSHNVCLFRTGALPVIGTRAGITGRRFKRRDPRQRSRNRRSRRPQNRLLKPLPRSGLNERASK